MLYKRSSELFLEAQEFIPGGVNSPVRAFKSVGGHPIFVNHAQGPYIYDEDSRKYIDYISSWGPLMYGHCFQPVIKAISESIKLGTSFGMPTYLETQMAKRLLSMVPHMDKVRFVNSGTEACMSAIRLARGYTGRNKIIKFEGCYHGHADSFLIQAGSGGATLGEPNSLGVPSKTIEDTLLASYNNLDSVKVITQNNKTQIAAIIIEPIAGNMGCIPPKKGFLEGLRNLCDEQDILLVFDEVMTGFRLAKGGAQETLKVKADIATFGKIIGGGLPVGAFAASKEIMSHISPEGKVYQAGTLSGNPIAMSAGLAMLDSINNDPSVFNRLSKKTEYLHKAFDDILKGYDIPYSINRYGSMMSIHFTKYPVVDFESSSKGNNPLFKTFFHGMLKNGIYLPPSAFESWFLNDALTYEDLDYTILAFEKVIKTITN